MFQFYYGQDSSKFYPKITEHIRPGALINFRSKDGDENIHIHLYTKSRSQNRTHFCSGSVLENGATWEGGAVFYLIIMFTKNSAMGGG